MTNAFGRYSIQLALVAVAAVWGATFVMVKDAVAAYPLYSFLGLRFAIAVIAFAIIFPRSVRMLNGANVATGVLAGAFLCLGYIFQTWGLAGTTASKAAFITGLFVVLTPALQALVLRHVPSWPTLLGVAAAMVGMWLLTGASASGWNTGDTRVFLCALAYSAHMIVLGGPGKKHDALPLTLVQLATTAAVCGVIALVFEQPLALPGAANVWVALLVTGVLASAIAFAIQTYAQRHLTPTRTALILITEPAFGGVFGWLAGETLGVRGLSGALLILVGMVVAEVVGSQVEMRERVVLETSIEGPTVPLVEAETPTAEEVKQQLA